jgi:general secretion pathway protein G
MKHTAFTLVEILIVVIILGILAVIVLPQFSNATQTAKASMLADGLRVYRTQTSVYKAQHQGVAPGYPDGDRTAAPTQAAFLDQMTLSSDPTGATAAVGTAGYRYGPYFSQAIQNPINNLSTVTILADNAAMPAEPDGTTGWYFKPSTMEMRANCAGGDEQGRNYFDY